MVTKQPSLTNFDDSVSSWRGRKAGVYWINGTVTDYPSAGSLFHTGNISTGYKGQIVQLLITFEGQLYTRIAYWNGDKFTNWSKKA